MNKISSIFNLENAVGSQKSTQAITTPSNMTCMDALMQRLQDVIELPYASFLCSTALSRFKKGSLALSLALVLPQAYATNNSPDWDKDGLSDEVEALVGSEMYLSDTDGDGISDKDEIGSITEPRDTDNDGKIDVLDVDDDGDGIPTAIEGLVDSDKDGKPDYLDTDSDGDGLVDRLEVRLTGKDSDRDGVDDLFDVDSTKGQDDNGDGIDDHIALVDSNGNGIPDLLDNKSTLPHVPQKSVVASKKIKTANKTKQSSPIKLPKKLANKKEVVENPVVVSAATLPTQVTTLAANTKPKPSHKYMVSDKDKANKKITYGGSGFFYCGSNGKIVKGIQGFMVTPPSKVTLLRNAQEGDYKWSADVPGTYALQFQIPQGMSIVRGLAKGRRIVKSGDTNPLILGASENPAKKGFLKVASGSSTSWYTSFEVKDNAPFIANNNIPLSGGICGE